MQIRVVTEELYHDLHCVPPHTTHPTGYVDQLILDFGANVGPGNVRKVDKHRDIPLEVGDVLVQTL